ncbi:MAG TPA: class I SAM-dependent methyltransferase [Thermoanaerobaculaceae bacterium]|nr:class I SAM-dependent methyltransferase [Thermoanaerobaculaceae bacterium]
MTFPDFKTWVQDVLHPRDLATGRGPYCFETEAWYQVYRNKHRIAEALRPLSVLEIGVRYGYAAHAFLTACSVITYVGVDVDDPVINAMGEPTCAWAMEMLSRTTPARVLRGLIKVNTRTTDIRSLLPNRTFDLTHIDADHTFAGALDDITKAWELTSGAMLVDDYFGSPPVRDAVDRFVSTSGALLVTSPSGTGEALLLK